MPSTSHPSHTDTAAAITFITTQALALKSLPISPAWLSSFLSSTSRPPSTPLPALTQTAIFRVLASDIQTSLSTTDTLRLLPLDVGTTSVKERRLEGDVVVQVLDIEDVGRSKWGMVEEVERGERGEKVKGREVIRSVPAEDTGDGGGAGDGGARGAGGPHTLVLQDARGTRVKAFERSRVEGLGIPSGERGGFAMGAKMLLKKGTTVWRGCVMVEGEGRCVLLGGKIEGLDKAWRAGRKARLVAEVERRDTRDAGNGNKNGRQDDAVMGEAG